LNPKHQIVEEFHLQPLANTFFFFFFFYVYNLKNKDLNVHNRLNSFTYRFIRTPRTVRQSEPFASRGALSWRACEPRRRRSPPQPSSRCRRQYAKPKADPCAAIRSTRRRVQTPTRSAPAPPCSQRPARRRCRNHLRRSLGRRATSSVLQRVLSYIGRSC